MTGMQTQLENAPRPMAGNRLSHGMLFWFALLIALCGPVWPVRAAQTAEKQRDDKQAIRKSSAAYAAAFQRGDARQLAAMFAKDAELVDSAGEVFCGRQAIEEECAAFFRDNKGATIEVTVQSIRFPSPDLALEDGTTTTTLSPDLPRVTARYTAVHVRQDGKWLIASVREKLVDAGSNYWFLKGLEWLIGDWTAEHNGKRLVTRCEWMPGRNFIQRTYRHYQDDKLVASGLQIIGWDAEKAAITSWSFDSEGGVATGVWTHDGQRWLVPTSGFTRGGNPTSATNIVTPRDADHFTWESKNRRLDRKPLPDAAPIDVARQKPKS